MAEQLAVEVDVKNVTEDGQTQDKLLYLVRILIIYYIKQRHVTLLHTTKIEVGKGQVI